MQLLSITLIATIAVTTGVVSAKPPRQPRVSQYSRLWTASPFTIKPTAPVTTVASPLERDWSLGSIVPVNNGYAVTLINKKDRKDRVRFLPGFSAGEFKLLEVKQNINSRKESRVLISKGSQKGWITYDEKVVALRVAATSRKKVSSKTSSKTGTRSGHMARPPIPGKTSSKSSSRVRHVPRTK